MSIYGLARAPTNLFLLITHNFQAVQQGCRLVPRGVRSQGCRDCLFICLFIYTDAAPRTPPPSAVCSTTHIPLLQSPVWIFYE